MLGDLLRETRESLNLTLEDAEKGTNIRKLYIQALENGDYDKLPKAEVFCKGFLKSYGKYLKLNTDMLLSQYEEERQLQSTKVEVELSAQYQVQSKEVDEEPQTTTKEQDNNKPHNIVRRTQLSDFATHQQYVKTSTINKKKLLGIIAIIILILIAIISFVSSKNSNNAPINEQTKISTVEKAPTSKPIVLNAKFNNGTHVVVTADGKEILNQDVSKDANLNWDADKELIIIANNPEAITITLNGNSPQLLSKSSKKTTIKFFINKDGKVEIEDIPSQASPTKPETKRSEEKIVQPEKQPVVSQPLVEKKVKKVENPPVAPVTNTPKAEKIQPTAKAPTKENTAPDKK